MAVRTVLFFLFLANFYIPKVYAQTDTLAPLSTTSEITVQPNKLSPRKATLMSAALPGLGQAYTKSYWKIPILYTGAGIIGYLLIDNNQKYILWRDRYINQRTAIENGFDEPVKYQNGEPISLEVLKRAKDTYRRYRDLNVILAGLLYVLNIADANVTAHLKTFDLGKDLTMRIQPDLLPSPYLQQPIAAVSIRFTIK
jgi:hypothetical protein